VWGGLHEKHVVATWNLYSDALRILKSSYGKLFNTDEVTSVLTIVDRSCLLSIYGMNNAKFVNGQ